MTNPNDRMSGLICPGLSSAAALSGPASSPHAVCDSGFDSYASHAKCSIWLKKAGTRFFDSVEEAALFLLCNESISLLRFCRYAVEQKANLMSNLESVAEENVWRYLQLRDTSTQILERKLLEIEQSLPSSRSASPTLTSTSIHRSTEKRYQRLPDYLSCVRSTPSTAMSASQESYDSVTSRLNSASRFSTSTTSVHSHKHDGRVEFHETEPEPGLEEEDASGIDTSPLLNNQRPAEGHRRATETVNRAKSERTATDSSNPDEIPHKGGEETSTRAKKGRRRLNTRNLTTSLNGVDVTLAQSMSINFQSGGELVSFAEVKKWTNPTTEELVQLRDKVVETWIKPLALKQQDIVKATGVGAPYICYLFRDPDNPNMTTRRRVEAFCVLSELMRKYEENQVTKNDFIKLRDARVERRYLKRQHTRESSSLEPLVDTAQEAKAEEQDSAVEDPSEEATPRSRKRRRRGETVINEESSTDHVKLSSVTCDDPLPAQDTAFAKEEVKARGNVTLRHLQVRSPETSDDSGDPSDKGSRDHTLESFPPSLELGPLSQCIST